ncbi:unnamed protein product [Bursaphelenchus xylophilus]|uniref:F-actin-capping protein subunit beta n=1 Tax=Bursaphelenchus xylophilus TaxID=6326 RepID=A0A1I7RPK1_BURXY|nr:unnamed protein product [Bursaphelenchus xylophilus]CAG9096153.1 unnamed protein product [Bursaphelenchus xylophilus]
MTNPRLDTSLDLMRRLPPQKCSKHVTDIISLAPDLCNDILSMVDQPLQVAKDRDTGREYLLCDYNRDMDSYRSPWSNVYDPPLDEATYPPEELRKMEVEANALFQGYVDMYFEGGVSSVYFWEFDQSIAGVFLIKKKNEGLKGVNGCWDSIHVIEYKPQKHVKYKLTSTVILWLQTDNDGVGEMSVGGSMTRQSEIDAVVDDHQSSHLVNIGKLIEDNENKMRSLLNDIYFGKTREIVGSLRTIDSATELGLKEKLAEELRDAIQQNNSKEK